MAFDFLKTVNICYLLLLIEAMCSKASNVHECPDVVKSSILHKEDLVGKWFESKRTFYSPEKPRRCNTINIDSTLHLTSSGENHTCLRNKLSEKQNDCFWS